MSKGSFKDFLNALGEYESGKPTGDPNQYQVVSNYFNFTGKFQFAEPLLIDLGYYIPGPNGYYGQTATNEWKGSWTGKNGINSYEEFKNSPAAQEAAIREAFALNYESINKYLAKEGKSIDDYIGKAFNYTENGIEKQITLSLTGFLAGAHLRGPDNLVKFLIDGYLSKVHYDEYGTPITQYINNYGGYSASTQDFFFLGEGDGGERHMFDFTWKWGANEIVSDFNPVNDAINLKDFWYSYKDFKITTNEKGDVVINLYQDEHSITLENVKLSQFSDKNIVGVKGNFSDALANKGPLVVNLFDEIEGFYENADFTVENTDQDISEEIFSLNIEMANSEIYPFDLENFNFDSENSFSKLEDLVSDKIYE